MKTHENFPPVPAWRPEFKSSNEELLERMEYYTDGKNDLAIFKNGTIVVLEDGLTEERAVTMAKTVLSNIFNQHPDMNPMKMDDGNMLIEYNYPAYNIVIEEFISSHIDEIRNRHLDALPRHEVLIMSGGQNKFDEFGMKALYGRCFMFMDAQCPEVVKIKRKSAER